MNITIFTVNVGCSGADGALVFGPRHHVNQSRDSPGNDAHIASPNDVERFIQEHDLNERAADALRFSFAELRFLSRSCKGYGIDLKHTINIYTIIH